MHSILRIILFIIGVAIIFLYLKFHLYNLGVLFYFIPLFGLVLMGINFFGPTSTTPKNENNEVEHREFTNLDNSKYTALNNPNNDVGLVKDFIEYTNDLTSLIFIYRGKKQIVTGVSLENEKLASFNLIENTRKSYNLNEIRQLKRVNGYNYYWERHKLSQDFVQIRDYFRRYLSVSDSDFIRFRGGDNGSYIYSWKLTDNLITNFNKKGEGEQHFYRYLTLSFYDFLLKGSVQKVIKDLGIENNYIVAFDYEKNENRLYFVEKVYEFEILYS